MNRKRFLLGLLGAGISIVHAETLPPVVVSATRSAQSEVSIPARIDVITQADIAASGAANLTEVIRGHGMVQITDTYGDGSRSVIGMRGFSDTASSNTLILVDGRRLNNIDIASPDLNSIALKDVERVEIIQGSAGVLFGDQAVGGVINIITRRPQAFSARVDAGLGSYSGGSLTGQVSGRLDNGLFYRLSGEHRNSDNFRDHNGIRYENAFGLLGYEYATGSVFVEVQQVDERLELPGALYVSEVRVDRETVRPEYRNDFSDTDTEIWRIGLNQDLTTHWSFEGEITERRSDGEFRQSFRSWPATSDSTQDRVMRSFNPRLIGSYQTAAGEWRVTLGLDHDRSDYELRSFLGFQQIRQTREGWYAQLVAPLNPQWQFTAGLRHEQVDNDLRDTFTFPAGIDVDDDVDLSEIGLAYRPDANWRLFARLDENLRFAKVDELTNPAGITVLDTQTGHSLEAGVEYQGDDWQWSATAYELRLRNELAYDPVFFANRNLDETEREGLALKLQYTGFDAWRLAADIHLLSADVVSGPFAGSDIPMVANETLRLSADYRLDDHWSFYGELQATGERPYSGDFNNVLDDLAGYGVVNANVNYRRGGWHASLRVNNLFDREYAEFGARSDEFLPPTWAVTSFEAVQPSPERNLWLTVGYQFD